MMSSRCFGSWTRYRIMIQVWATSPIPKSYLFVKGKCLILAIIPCTTPCFLLTIPSMMLKTSLWRPEPSWDWVNLYGWQVHLTGQWNFQWLNFVLHIFWIISWCSQSWVCRLLCAVLSWTLYCSTTLLMADSISIWWLHVVHQEVLDVFAVHFGFSSFNGYKGLLDRISLHVLYLPWSSTCWACKAS